MRTRTDARRSVAGGFDRRRPWCLVTLAAGLLALSSTALLAQVTVTTLGGGPIAANGPFYGDRDGNTLQNAQFHYPWGCAVDRAGFLFVADSENGKIRRLDLQANLTTTFISGLSLPVAVAFDATNDLYVLNQGNGSLIKFDRFNLPTLVATNLAVPTAMVMGSNLIYLTELGGVIKRVSLTNSYTVTILATGLNQPHGIAIMDSGLLAVSETGSHSIRLLDPVSGVTLRQIGATSPGPGFRDGPAALAQFNRPFQVAKVPSGALVVTDRGNQRVRLITPDDVVTTLYGLDPSAWGPGYPGWFDGSAEYAEAREPVGITVAPDGTVYTTEVFYHLIRRVTGAGLAGGGPGTNFVVLPPQVSPLSGYFPFGTTLTVINPNTNAFFNNVVYYTTDGTEPTTNSQRLVITGTNPFGALGTIAWRENLHDLASLRVKAFAGPYPSATVSGQAATVSQIGFPRDVQGGIGATIVVPVVANLRPNDQLQSVQFRIEITPNTPGTPLIPTPLAALETTDVDFLPVVQPSASGSMTALRTTPYQINNTRGLVITTLGAETDLLIANFAAIILLKVPISPAAHEVDSYTLEVLQVSGTADGLQTRVELTPMPNRTLVVTNLSYIVGNSAPGLGFNAGEFGDGVVDNADVNNVFRASLGERLPPQFTDVFDAMDAFPEDSPGVAGGDGLIRYLDWQVVLNRTLGLEAGTWKRSWSPGGMRVAATAHLGGSADTAASPSSGSTEAPAWFRQATMGAITLENINPGSPAAVPVYLRVANGFRVAGLEFRASLLPEGGAPDITQPMSFEPASGIPSPGIIQHVTNDLLCGWMLNGFNPPLQSSNFLGYLRFIVPLGARSGQSYTLHFYADGAPDATTQYDFDGIPGSVWVQSAALQPPEIISDEWKVHFFGSLTNPLARADADPDGDGFSNAAEYLSGLNPAQADWYYRCDQASFTYRWFAATGGRTVLSGSTNLVTWTPLTTVDGDNQLHLYSAARTPQTMQFYRLSVSPAASPH